MAPNSGRHSARGVRWRRHSPRRRATFQNSAIFFESNALPHHLLPRNFQWGEELPVIPQSPSCREYHLNYEIWMLEETYKQRHADEVINNALIESFCVHARNLFEFFREEASQYIENYRPFSHITENRRKAIVAKLNIQITHVKFQGRAKNDADKITRQDRTEILNILSDEINEFKTHLAPQYSAAEIRDLPRVLPLRVNTHYNNRKHRQHHYVFCAAAHAVAPVASRIIPDINTRC